MTTSISVILLDYFILPPQQSFLLTPQSFLFLLLFLGEGFLVSFLIDRGKRQNSVIQYRQKEKEYLKSIRELEELSTKIKEEIRQRDEFVSIASHELKTPLTSMLLQIQSALHNIRHVSLAEFSVDNLLTMLESTEHQTRRLSKMINDLLNISLITTGRLELEKEYLNLSNIIQGVVNDFSIRLKKDGYALMLQIPDEIMGMWDKVRIEQALSNLISNAIKYGEKKPVSIIVVKGRRNVKIVIKDEGIGIPAQDQTSIFELFKRAVPNTTYKGLGVGLYITKQIITAHKGMIAVESRVGKGSQFTIVLPIEQAKFKDEKKEE